MKTDAAFHYPPDLLELLVDTIPLLHKGKKSVLIFFRGAGVPPPVISDLSQQVEINRDSISKYEIARTVLTRVNEKGEVADFIRIRREIIKRVTAWEDYSTCYPENMLKAEGAVARVRHLVEAVDYFRRLKNEREAERRRHQEAKDAEISKIRERKDEFQRIKNRFYGLFAEENPQTKGKILEDVLNQLFKYSGILVREAFTVHMENGKTLEQIDGSIDLDGFLYIVEVKWWKEPVGAPEINKHASSIFLRGKQVRGIFISYSGYTDSAVETCRQAVHAGAFICLLNLQEFVNAIENEDDIGALLRTRINAILLDRGPRA